MLVAFVSREACSDTMSDERFDYRARVSMPDGTLRVGCCSALAGKGAATRARARRRRPLQGRHPRRRRSPRCPPIAGRVVGLALEDGTMCRSSGRGGRSRSRAAGSTSPARRRRTGAARSCSGPSSPPVPARSERAGSARPRGRSLRPPGRARGRGAGRGDRDPGQRLCVSPPQGPRIDLGQRPPHLLVRPGQRRPGGASGRARAGRGRTRDHPCGRRPGRAGVRGPLTRAHRRRRTLSAATGDSAPGRRRTTRPRSAWGDSPSTAAVSPFACTSRAARPARRARRRTRRSCSPPRRRAGWP